jgi:hypothetical protein
MTERKSTHETGMAGEFFVMEQLFRLHHEPALTLGNAKNIDIIVRTQSGVLKVSAQLTPSLTAVNGMLREAA